MDESETAIVFHLEFRLFRTQIAYSIYFLQRSK